MDNLREFFQKNAIYSADQEIVSSDIKNVLSNYNLRILGIGASSRAHRIDGQDWVIKEGRWDLDLSLFEQGKLKLHAELTENFLKMFSYTFLPRKEEILRQYSLYLDFVKYFGCFEYEESYFHPEKSEIIKEQKLMRELMLNSREKIEDYYNFKIENDFWDKLVKRDEYGVGLLYYNFLPEEYLLYGNSISKENKGKDTYYICQDFVEGRPLHDIKNEDLTVLQRDRLSLLALCTLFMNMAIGIVPDLRPRYILTEAYDWFSMTENIIIKDDELRFIDTRWFWRAEDNLVKRGLLIPELTINSAKKFLLDV